MNDTHEFDDLARQKLERRAFPFDEANWADAERAINERKRRRSRRGLWLFSASALLLLTAGWWWLAQQGTSATAEGSAAAVRINEPAPSTEVAATTNETTTNAPPTPTNGTSTGTPTLPERTIERPVPAAQEQGTVHTTNTPAPSTASRPAKAPATTAPPVEVTAIVGSAPIKVNDKTNVQPVATEKANDTNTANAATTDPNVSVFSTGSATTVATDQPSSTVETPGADVTNAKGTPTERPTLTDVPAAIAPMEVKVVPAASIEGTPAEQPASQETQATAPEASKEQEGASTLQPPAQDSAATAPGTTLPLLLIAPVAYTEIDLLGGLFSSTATYSGGNSDKWSNDVQRVSKPSFGLELAHMGKNIGYGGGVHYAEYAERLHAEEQNTYEDVYSVHYHLMPVDTMVTIVVDTIYQQGVAYYVTQHVSTTINVLESETDTANVVHQERAARELVNSVRYLEVPLFLDAHVSAGRWMFGVRGGPSIGFLTGRKGALPNDTFDGYTDLGDRPFSTVVWGYHARAYIRYRLGTAWAIGVEPAVHGQLSNAFDDADLTRKGSAMGGFLSLTYRLP